MKILLSSFGVTENVNDKPQSPYYLMPPMRSVNNSIMPDYSTLLLFNQIVMDVNSFDFVMQWNERVEAQISRIERTKNVSNKEKDDLSKSILAFIDTFKLMKQEGFIELVDFNAILGQRKNLLKKMLDYDMSISDVWMKPLKTSLQIWDKFTKNAPSSLNPHPSSLHIANNKTALIKANLHLRERMLETKKPYERDVTDILERHLREYLNYVNCNLILSNTLNVPFHDWGDYSPFYEQKFLSVGQIESNIQKEKSYAQKLFQVSFPEFEITKPSTFMKVLTDKRIEDLRSMIRESVENGNQFDVKFARETLKTVFNLEKKTAKYRSLISWVTKPIDFIPWAGNLASMLVDEFAGHMVEQKIKKDFRWFYLLSDIAENGT